MANTVKLIQSIDDRDVVQAFQRQLKLLDKVERRLDQTGKKGATAGKQQAQGWNQAASGLLKFITIGAGIATLRREMENLIRARDKIRDVAIDSQKALGQVRANFVPDRTVTQAQFDERVRRGAKATKVEQGEFAAALSPALSAKGSKTNEWAFQAVEAALRFTDRNAAAAAALTGIIGDTASLGESQDPRAIMGWLGTAQTQARMTSVEELGKSAAPVLLAGREQGLTAEQAMEVYATSTRLGGDATGRISATGVISLFDKLGKETSLQGNALEKLEQLRANPAMLEEFLSKSSFEAKFGPVARAIITGSGQWQRELASTQQSLPSIAATEDRRNVESFERRVKFIQGSGTAPGELAQGKASVDQAIEEYQQSKGGEAGTVSQIRDVMVRTQEALDQGLLSFIPHEIRKRMLDWSASESPEVAARFATRNLEEMGQLEKFRFDDEAQQLIRSAVESINGLVTALNENNTETRDNTRETRNAFQNSGPPTKRLSRP